MSCIIDNGYALGCSSIGGVEKLYFGTYDADATFALSADNTITGATSFTNVAYLFEQDLEYAGLTQTGVYNRENGTVHNESNVSAKFINLDATLRNTLNALSKAPLFAIVKSNAGNWYFLGLESAGRATEGAATVGVSMGDMNGGTITIQFKSIDGAYLIDSTLIGTDIPTS